MLPDRVSNLGPLTYESGALPVVLRGPAKCIKSTYNCTNILFWQTVVRILNTVCMKT